MFSFLLARTTSNEISFCYAVDGKESECSLSGAIHIKSFEQGYNQIMDINTKAIFQIINDPDHPLEIPNTIDKDIQYSFEGKTNSVVKIIMIKNKFDINSKMTFKNLHITFSKQVQSFEFNDLELSNIVFEPQNTILEIKAETLTADLKSLKDVNTITAHDSNFEFNNEEIPRKKIDLRLTQYSSKFGILLKQINGNLFIKQNGILLKVADSAEPIINVIMEGDATAVATSATVYASTLAVDCDPYLELMSFEPTVSHGGILKLGAHTGCLSTGKTLSVKGGTIESEENDFDYTLDLTQNAMTKLIFKKRLQFSKASLINHQLTISGPEKSVLAFKSLQLMGDVQITSDAEASISGSSLTIEESSKIALTKVILGKFETVKAPLGVTSISGLDINGSKLSIPLNINKQGKLETEVSFGQGSNLQISVTHSADPSEGPSSYDSLIGVDIPLFCAKEMDCSSISLEVEASADPFESPKNLFTKERIVFERTCSATCVGMKILDNPANVYQSYIYADNLEGDLYGMSLISHQNLTSWTAKTSKHTKGVSIRIHNGLAEDAISLDGVSADGISFVVRASEYAGHDNLPSVSINADSLSHCSKLTLDDVSASFVSYEDEVVVGVPSIDIKTGTALKSMAFKLSGVSSLSLPDSLISTFPVGGVSSLRVYVSEESPEIHFQADGWAIRGAASEYRISRNYALTLTMDQGSRVHLCADDGVTLPSSFAFEYNGPSLILTLDKGLENFKTMLPITVKTASEHVSLSTAASYVPIQFVGDVNLMISSDTSGIEIDFPDQTITNGKLAIRPADPERIGAIRFRRVLVRDSSAAEQVISGSPKMAISELRVSAKNPVRLETIPSKALYLDDCETVTLSADSIIDTRLTINAFFSPLAMPKLVVDGKGNANFSSLHVDVSPNGAIAEAQPLFMSYVIVSDPGMAANLRSLEHHISLAKTSVAIGGRFYNVGVTVTDTAVLLTFSEAADPSSPSSDPAAASPTPSMSAFPIEPTPSTGGVPTIAMVAVGGAVIVVGVILIIVVVLKKKNSKLIYSEIDSDAFLETV